MRKRILLISAALIGAAPALAAAPGSPTVVADSVQAHSSVSIMVDPQLNDGRLVVKIAAKNLGTAPVPFGPSNVSIAKPNGEAVALYPLQALINDVRVAAGMPVESMPTPTQGAYAAPQMTVREGGQLDVTGYTGGATVGSDEYIHRNQTKKGKATISEAEAQSQIATLNAAILHDSMLASGQIVAGQAVSDKLKFAKAEDRTLHLRVRIAGDEHGFTIEAPSR
jgi:hypothetical protein